MINEDVIDTLKKRYEGLHPLVFHRSLEKSDNASELFDILETIPKAPFAWDDSSKKWTKVSDFYFISKVKSILTGKEDSD